MPERNTKFTIMGGGLAGGLMATYLGRAGYRADVYEKRPDLRNTEMSPGRSINLALSTRGIHALEQAGLADEILAAAVPMRGRMIHPVHGEPTFQPYSKNPNDVINSVSRAALNIALLNAAERCDSVRLFFNRKCVGVDVEAASVQILDATNNSESTVDGDVILGADGAFSAVRRRMQTMDRFDYRQDHLKHGYKELSIPPGPNGQHVMEKNALHIWPRQSFMMIALPNMDGSFTCTIFMNLDGPDGLTADRDAKDVARFFNKCFPDALPLMPTVVDDFMRYPASSLMTVRCSPWHVRDKVVLIGDACHAIVPFFGQGINAGFEDCVVLRECIEKQPSNLEEAFDLYHRRRKPHTDALAELSIANFVEMRDHASSPAFLRKKKRERWLHERFPDWYQPLYSLVTFSRMPYADAVHQSARKERTVGLVLRCLYVIPVLLILCLTLWLLR